MELYPSLEDVFLRFGSPPIRNAGTLGGNVANGSPIGDSMPALLVLDTSLVLRSAAGTRSLPLADFYLGYQQTALQQGEFIETIRVPLPTPGEHVASYKISKRFDQDISAVCAAFRLVPDGNTVADIRIAYGGMAEVPKRASNCEKALRGKLWDDAAIAAAGPALAKDYAPISDMRSSASYRQRVAHKLLQRFHLETNAAAELQVYGYGR
jgi:xanthine dehydrogenase small subunit